MRQILNTRTQLRLHQGIAQLGHVLNGVVYAAAVLIEGTAQVSQVGYHGREVIFLVAQQSLGVAAQGRHVFHARFKSRKTFVERTNGAGVEHRAHPFENGIDRFYNIAQLVFERLYLFHKTQHLVPFEFGAGFFEFGGIAFSYHNARPAEQARAFQRGNGVFGQSVFFENEKVHPNAVVVFVGKIHAAHPPNLQAVEQHGRRYGYAVCLLIESMVTVFGREHVFAF